MNVLRNPIFVGLMSILFLSCSNDDRLPEPRTGHFVKRMIIEEDQDKKIIDFVYNVQNQLIKQKTGTNNTMEFGYNELGQMIEYKENGKWNSRFEYNNNRISKIVSYNALSGEISKESAVTFSNGIYMTEGDTICKIDGQNQLLEIPPMGIAFTYGDAAGVHTHLKPIPAHYFLDFNLTIYDLSLSNQELKGITTNTKSLSMENLRNDQGLITTIILTDNFTGEEVIWEVIYEERELVN